MAQTFTHHHGVHPGNKHERRFCVGLIYYIDKSSVVLPEEFCAWLSGHVDYRVLDSERDVAVQPETANMEATSNPVLDIVLFLAYLQQKDVRPLRDRWLSHWHVRQLAGCIRSFWVKPSSTRHRLLVLLQHLTYNPSMVFARAASSASGGKVLMLVQSTSSARPAVLTSAELLLWNHTRDIKEDGYEGDHGAV